MKISIILDEHNMKAIMSIDGRTFEIFQTNQGWQLASQATQIDEAKKTQSLGGLIAKDLLEVITKNLHCWLAVNEVQPTFTWSPLNSTQITLTQDFQD